VLVTFCHFDKRAEKINLKEERLTWLMVSEVLDHGCLVTQAFGEAEHQDRKTW
jgi:hypothetical protein